MRTLKKVLALTMAMAMAFSLMAFAADFTDKSSIDPKLVDDVNLLVAVNIIKGYDTGDFKPAGTITRAEAAKMIYVLKWKGVDDGGAQWKNLNLFSDVSSSEWYAGYVNYCASIGIVAGVGNNKFDPDASVTGLELAKMLLVCANYDATIEGMVGANWANNTLALADSVGILDDYNYVVNMAAPRQWVCKLFTNSFDVKYVYYLGQMAFPSGTLAGGTTETVGSHYMGLETMTGVLTASNMVSLGGVKTGATAQKLVTVNGKTENASYVKASYDLTYTMDESLLGQEVKVIFNISKASGSAPSTFKDCKIYSIIPTGKSAVYNTTYDNVSATAVTTGTKLGEKLSFTGYTATVYDQAGTDTSSLTGNALNCITVFTNDYTSTIYHANSDQVTATFGGTSYGALKTAFDGKKVTWPVKMIDADGDGYIDYAFISKVQYALVNSVDLTAGTLKVCYDGSTVSTIAYKTPANLASYNLTKVADLAKNDVISITANYASGTCVYDVAKVAPVVATANGKSGTSSSSTVTFGDKSYSFAPSKGGAGWENLNDANYAPATVTLGTNYNVYTDGKYVVYFSAVSEDTATVLGNLAYVIGASVVKSTNSVTGVATWTEKVQVLKSDGTTATYDYYTTDVSGKVYLFGTTQSGSNTARDALTSAGGATSPIASTTVTPGQVYQYVLRSDGTIYFKNATIADTNVTANWNLGSAANVVYDNSKSYMTIGGTAYAVGSSSWYFVHYVDNGTHKYAVINGSALGSISTGATSATYATKTVDGLKTVLFGAIEATGSLYNSKSNIPYVVALASSSQVYDSAKGQYYNVFSALNDKGETVTIKATASASKGKLYMVDIDTDGIATLTTVNYSSGSTIAGGWLVGRVDGYNATLGNVVIGGTYYTVDASTKVQYVSGGSIVSTGTFASGAKIYDGASIYNTNILYKLSGTKVTDAFVDVDGASITSLFAPSYIKFAAYDDSTANARRPFYIANDNGTAYTSGDKNLAISFVLDRGNNLQVANVRLVVTDQNNTIVANLTATNVARGAYTFLWDCSALHTDTRNYTYALIVTDSAGNTYTTTATTAVNVATLANQPSSVIPTTTGDPTQTTDVSSTASGYSLITLS